MTESHAKILEAAAALLWPIIVAILLWKLLPAIRGIVTSRNFSVKVGSMELSVQDATEQIRAQIEDLQKQVILLRSGRNGPPEAASVEEAPAEEPVPQAPPPRRILWVDDNPSNNAMETAQLRKQGIEVEQALSTDEALARLGSGDSFAAVISDMGRSENGHYRSRAGLALLEAIRGAGIALPFMVYTSIRSAAEQDMQVKAAGGTGATPSPTILMEWISQILGPGG